MELLINHLTRMQPGWVCAAGIELGSGKQIRPVSGHGLPSSLLARNGGPLRLGAVVELGPTEFCGKVPEIEDRSFCIENLKTVKQCTAAELIHHCEAIAGDALRDIFSDDLEWIHHDIARTQAIDVTSDRSNLTTPGTATVAQHRGIRSLGCYWASDARLVVVEKEDQRRVRLRFREGDVEFEVPVTDYRMYLADQKTPDEHAISMFASHLATKPRVLVAVGLSRPYRRTESQPARHWLQINNLLQGPSSLSVPTDLTQPSENV